MEYLNVPLKDGTTYGEYLDESVSYRQELYDDICTRSFIYSNGRR